MWLSGSEKGINFRRRLLSGFQALAIKDFFELSSWGGEGRGRGEFWVVGRKFFLLIYLYFWLTFLLILLLLAWLLWCGVTGREQFGWSQGAS